ncbi:hypothetical protein [Streptomyces anulatus]|uniref:hypothetical protein n=1 Tax=Streptomyces anulatus TaxID=1892 RepID=UPI00324CAACC|nr:hypothetical protein OH791_17345 [Streptomyces anulatus]
MGTVETTVRNDVEQLGDLTGIEPSLAEMTYALAHQIDLATSGECDACGEPVPQGDDGRTLPQLNRELRQTLAQLLEGRATDDDDDLGDLASPD